MLNLGTTNYRFRVISIYGIAVAPPIHMNQEPRKQWIKVESGWSGLYGLAFFGALVYFLEQATGFWNGAWRVVEAIFWPGVILYKVLEMLKA